MIASVFLMPTFASFYLEPINSDEKLSHRESFYHSPSKMVEDKIIWWCAPSSREQELSVLGNNILGGFLLAAVTNSYLMNLLCAPITFCIHFYFGTWYHATWVLRTGKNLISLISLSWYKAFNHCVLSGCCPVIWHSNSKSTQAPDLAIRNHRWQVIL